MKVPAIVKTLLGNKKRYRGDCPFCQGINSFSILDMGGKVIWKCFKQSCNKTGSSGDVSTASLKEAFGLSEEKPLSKFIVPTHWTTHLPETAIAWLKKTHAYEPCENLWIWCMHDPKQDRLVFLSEGERVFEPVGAIGRALSPTVLPKWFKYSKNNLPFIAKYQGKGSKHAVLVEDCASAGAISHFADGVALLGTTLTDEALDCIINKQYYKITVCLDNDAQLKAMDIAEELRYYAKVCLVNLAKDPKEYEPSKLQKILGL